jgi:hypothetical protein
MRPLNYSVIPKLGMRHEKLYDEEFNYIKVKIIDYNGDKSLYVFEVDISKHIDLVRLYSKPLLYIFPSSIKYHGKLIRDKIYLAIDNKIKEEPEFLIYLKDPFTYQYKHAKDE